MMERRLLKLAVVCFEKSGDELLRNKCAAALMADTAWYLHSTEPREAQDKFRSAATQWREAGEPLVRDSEMHAREDELTFYLRSLRHSALYLQEISQGLGISLSSTLSPLINPM